MPKANVVVIGATGNIGTSTVAALADDPAVASITGIARRAPEWAPPKTRWVSADLTVDPLVDLLRGADAVVSLAWLFQPTHDPVTTWRTNVLGSIRVFDAVAQAAVPSLVYVSSVGAYSPGPKDDAIDESWPTHGWPGAAYTREKAYLERVLDSYEREHPAVRVVRLRPGFVFKREAASQQRRLFGGPFVPNRLIRAGTVPVLPDVPGLRMQVVHSADVGEAVRLAALGSAQGAFNIATEPVVAPALLADLLGAKLVRLPPAAARAAVSALWHLRLVPASPGLFDAVRRIPIMDTSRASTELGWTPGHDAREALAEFLTGLARGAGMATGPLAASIPGGRAHELRTGIGQRP